MARETTTRLVDDLDNSDADETVVFGLDSRSYSIDLSESNASDLREALAPYVAVASLNGGTQKETPRLRGTRSRTPAPRSSDVTAIREWATQHGIPVKDRGRISLEVRRQYEAAVAV